jgi:hypothetical protein
MALPQLRLNPYVQPYTGGLSQEFGQSVDERLKKYEAAQEFEDILGYQTDTLLRNVGPFDNDRSYAQVLMNENRKNIEDRARRGDYENLGREVRKNARNFSASIQPLIINKQRHDTYSNQMKEALQKGEITRETYSDALRYSTENYKGIDPNSPETTYFNGFIPSKDINISKKLDDFYNNWKTDKGARDIIDPTTGLITKIDWEVTQKGLRDKNGRVIKSGEEIMKDAGLNAISTDPEVISYIQSQATIGNSANDPFDLNQDSLKFRVNREVASGLQSTIAKHYSEKYGQGIGFVPDSWLELMKEKLYNPPSAPSTPTANTFLKDRFEGFKFNGDNLIKDTEFYQANPDGTYNKFVDLDGNQVTFEDYKKERSSVSGQALPNTRFNVNRIPATQEEVAQIERKNNEELNQLAKDSYMHDRGVAYQGKMKEAFLSANNGRWNSPEYKKQVLERYNTAKKNFERVETSHWMKNRRADVKLIGNEYMDNSQSAITGLAGRQIAVMGKDETTGLPEGFRRSAIKDINSLYEEANKNGWQVKGLQDNGLLKMNPLFNEPASALTMYLEKGSGEDKEQRQVELAIGIGNADQAPLLQMIQDIGASYLNSSGGIVRMPGTNNRFRVDVIPGQTLPGQKDNIFYGYITGIDENNQDVTTTKSVNQFIEDFITSPAAKAETQRFLINPK